MEKDLESIQEARNLLQAAHDAWLKFEEFTEDQVERILLEISKAGIANAASVRATATGRRSIETFQRNDAGRERARSLVESAEGLVQCGALQGAGGRRKATAPGANAAPLLAGEGNDRETNRPSRASVRPNWNR